MVDIVPSALQHLRAADIIHMAGLSVAALGQEYSRRGAVHTTKRQGARLSGIVDVSHRASNEASGSGTAETLLKGIVDGSDTALGDAESPTNSAEEAEHVEAERRQHHVEVEIHRTLSGGQVSTSWSTRCSCGLTSSISSPTSICQHAAALLYQWVNHPTSFVSSDSAPPEGADSTPPGGAINRAPTDSAPPPVEQRRRITVALSQTQPTGQAGQSIAEILGSQGLSELRSIAREYEINTVGLSKQELLDAVLEALQRPEAIRRAVSRLEKPQRQLLATFALAGSSMNEEELRGLAERFSLGTPTHLQNMLTALQKKGLIFRTSLHSSLQRLGLSGTPFDASWHIPPEVRATLRVTLPFTPFDIEKGGDGKTETPIVRQVEPYSLLADLLLVARALEGRQVEYEKLRDERSAASHALAEDSTAIPPPEGRLSSSLLAWLQSIVPRPLSFLRFAIRLLRLTDILYQDEAEPPSLHTLPNIAQLLLGPGRSEVAHDLFELWLTQPTYEELFDLQEEGLRLRCRTTLLNQPTLRPSELAAENSEARQTLVALLAQAPFNQWIGFPAFARFVYRLNPTFLQKKQRLFLSPHWWLEQEEGRPLHPTQLNDWLRAEGRYLTQLLQGALYWWGISDLAVSKDGNLLAFRLTPLAGYLSPRQGVLSGGEVMLLGNAPIVGPDPSLRSRTSLSRDAVGEILQNERNTLPTLEVRESGEILIPSTPAAWPLLELIEVFAEVAGVQDGRLCYRLTSKSLGDALSRGEQPTALLDLLHHTAGNGIEPDVPLAHLLAQIEGWTANYGRVRLYTGVTLLETADSLVMRELASTTSLEEQTLQTIHPTLLILKPQGAERILEELKRRGQSPLLHEGVNDATE